MRVVRVLDPDERSGGRGFSVELLDQLPDQLLDLDADLPHLLDG